MLTAKKTAIIDNVYVSYFDVLGFTARSNSREFIKKYQELVLAVSAIEDEGLSVFLLSDSIVMTSESFEKVKSHTRDFYTWGILHDCWIRGGISRGSIGRYESCIVIRPDKLIFPFLGDGYLSAYKLESMLNVSGIMIDSSFFVSGESNPGLVRDTDYVEYEEFLPKQGREGKKHLLLPREEFMKQILETMYFEEMLKSHAEDIDKYINTFCFFIKHIMENADPGTMKRSLEKLLEELKLHGRRALIPSKVMVIFVAVVEGLFTRFRKKHHHEYTNPVTLENDVNTILAALKEEGYLLTFIDYLLEYDKKRGTTLYKDINSIEANPDEFA